VDKTKLTSCHLATQCKQGRFITQYENLHPTSYIQVSLRHGFGQQNQISIDWGGVLQEVCARKNLQVFNYSWFSMQAQASLFEFSKFIASDGTGMLEAVFTYVSNLMFDVSVC
jgi:hypothetical protein